MSIELATLLMFGVMIVLLLSGLPIAFALAGSALLFGVFMWGPASIQVVIYKASDTMRENIIVAVPLFIFMACVLERSGIAEGLYKVMYSWMGPLRGGLAAGTVVGCTIIAAMSGISTTGVLMMGILGLPSMARRKYEMKIAMGAIMAGGALGILIPPSIPMIVYAAIAGQSVGKIFLGGIIPGFILSGLFIVYIMVRAYLNPDLCPPIAVEDRVGWTEKLFSLREILLPVCLVIGVLGSIFAGIATPTEAASVGAFGTLVSASIYRRFNWQLLKESAFRTLEMLAMVMWIVFGAGVFSSMYQGLGATQLIQHLLTTWPVNKWVIIILMQLTWMFLGCLMDVVSMLMVTAPVFIPVIEFLGLDPIWFAILYSVNSEMGYLTPPFGVNLFVMKGITAKGFAGREVKMSEIYQAALPFIGIQLLCLILVMIFPKLATWLPSLFLT
ncbi:MAG TPA: TRAP transporter large permease subunit [Nitrospirota bacterium]|nr:TRAP transporter large permease subunit [Nitrospirota bacterium]